MTNVERLIEETGGCGLYQILHVTFIHMCRGIAIWGVNMMAFGNYDPGWTCKQPSAGIPDHTTNVTWSHASEENKMTPPNCSHKQHCSYILFDQHVKSIVTEWNLICDKDWIPSLIISLQMVGQLMGSIAAGYVSENMGRKICLYSNACIFTLANFGAAFSVSWQMFAVMRFIIGLAIGGIISSAFVYAIEFLNSKWRGIVGGLPINNSCLVIFGVVVYFIRDWRWLQVITASFSLLALLTYFWISESVRWLTVHGKREEAKRIVVKVARYNQTTVPNMDIIDITSMKEKPKDNHKWYSYMDLFLEKNIRNITIKLSLLWCFEVTVYYSLSFSVKALPGNFYWNLIIFCASEVPCVMFTGLIVNCLGRVKSGAMYFGLGAIACGIAMVLISCDLPPEYHLAVVLLTMTAKGLVAGGRSIVRLCTGELTPTSIRALSYSFYLVVSRIGAIVSPYTLPGKGVSLGLFLMIQSCLLCLASVIFLSLPETKDKEMSDLLEAEKENGDGVEIESCSTDVIGEDVENREKHIGNCVPSIHLCEKQ